MVTVFTPGSWQQLFNLFFTLSAFVSDVLLIRICLFLAYLCVFLAGLMGYPSWPHFGWTGNIGADTIAWASFGMACHGLSLVLLLRDERRIKFASEDEEQMWRFFNRRSGMGRLEMREVLRHGRWRRALAGDVILEPGHCMRRFHLLVEGLVRFENAIDSGDDHTSVVGSGRTFDLLVANVFGVYIGFEKLGDKHLFTATAQTDCLLFEWDIQAMDTMATKLSPAVAAFWRNFVLCQVGLEFESWVHPSISRCCAIGEPEPPELARGARSRDFTDPLRPFESQRPTARSIASWVFRSISAVPPPGLRHTAGPTGGILARNRLLAMQFAASEETATLAAPDCGSLRTAPQQRSFRTAELDFSTQPGSSFRSPEPSFRAVPSGIPEGGSSDKKVTEEQELV